MGGWPSLPEKPKQASIIQISNLTSIAGVTDTTLVKIIAPGTNRDAYVNMKRCHSINALVPVDANYAMLYSHTLWSPK